jgi:hypothetical protein
MRVPGCAIASALLAGACVAEPIPKITARDAPTVDLGYSVYSGSYDAASNINVFKGYGSRYTMVTKLQTDAVIQSSICSTATRQAQMGSSPNSSKEQNSNDCGAQGPASLPSNWSWSSNSCGVRIRFCARQRGLPVPERVCARGCEELARFLLDPYVYECLRKWNMLTQGRRWRP